MRNILEKPLFNSTLWRKTRIIETPGLWDGIYGGPESEVLHIVSHRAKRGLSTFIGDIEHELDISKSVTTI